MTSNIYPIISADSHIVEPPDLYLSRMPSEYRDRAPRIRRQTDADGREFDAWFIENQQVVTLGTLTQAGQRYNDPSQIDFVAIWEHVRPGTYQPDAMLKDLEADGIWGAIVQASQGLLWYHIEDSKMLSAICHAYNSWIADFCKPHPHRLRGIAMLNVDDVLEACAELERCAELGLAGAFIPVAPLADRPYRHPIYDRLWWTAQDLDIPLVLHFATQRFGVPGCDISIDFKTFTAEGMRPTQDYWVRYSLAAMIFAGVFERYPRLRVGSVEHEASWAPHWLRQMDFTYKERPVYRGYQSREKLLPSDYWRQNMFVNFQEDDAAVRLRDLIGVGNMMWGNDYPHSESTWPKSQDHLDQLFAGVPEAEKRKMTCDNAAALFKFELPGTLAGASSSAKPARLTEQLS